MPPLGLYIHVPFCGKKCRYCSFITDVPHTGEMNRFLDAIEHESCYWPDRIDRPVTSVFFGGGTPSLLGTAGLARLLRILWRSFDLAPGAEVTSEMNPESATLQTLGVAFDNGVNRISLGVQSFNNNVLQSLGRLHDARDAYLAIERARAAGFNNVSIDLMFGTPGQTLSIWKRDLWEAISIKTEHVSLYGLTVDEGTPLESDVVSGQVTVADEDLSAEMYECAIDTLSSAGLKHYEISNFAQPGREAEHNLNYWRHGEYIGLGPAAHSHLDGLRWRNTNNLNVYLANWEKGNAPSQDFREEVEVIDARRRLSDSVILGLRTLAGIEWPLPSEAGDPCCLAELEQVTDRYRELGLLESSDGRLRLTRRGLLLSNEVFAGLLLDEEPSHKLP